MKKLPAFLVLLLCSTCLAEADPHIEQLQQMHAKAENLIAVNDFRGAILAYQDILFVEADDETAYANLGRCYLLLGNSLHAKEAFLNALDINPENEAALRGLEKLRDPDAS